jgi:hypothetical protein
MPGSKDGAAVIDRLKERYGAVLAVETLPDSASLSRRYGGGDGRLVLVRPDGYVAFKASADQVDLLQAHLDRLTAANSV